MTPGDASSIDDLVARLRARVDERRRAGLYPPGLEEELDRHFHHIAVRGVRDRLNRLREAFEEADARGQTLAASRIDTASERPGGSAVHGAVAKLVGRQIEGALAQVREYADALAETHRAQLLAYSDLVARLDELRDRFVVADHLPDETKRVVADVIARVEALEDVASRRSPTPPSADDLSPAGTAERADRLAERLRSHAPTGVAGSDELVDALAQRGLDVVALGAGAVEALRDAADGAFGSVVLSGVFETLAPRDQLELVALVAARTRVGGLAVVEARNPHTLLGPDPESAAPAHPAYVSFLLAEAGFGDAELDWGGEPADSGAVEATVARLGRALFGARAYTLVAVRR